MSFIMKKTVLISLFLAESALAMPPAHRHAVQRRDEAQKYEAGYIFDNVWRDDCSHKRTGPKNFTQDMNCMIETSSSNGASKEACVSKARQDVKACDPQLTTKQCLEGPWLQMLDCGNGATSPYWTKLNPGYKPDSTPTSQIGGGTTGNGPDFSEKPEPEITSTSQTELGTTCNGPEVSKKPEPEITSSGQAEDETMDKNPGGPTSTVPGTNTTEQDTEYSNIWREKCLAPSMEAREKCRDIQDFGQKCERTRNEDDMKCLLDNIKTRAKTDFTHNVCTSTAVNAANDCFYTNNKGKTLPQCQREQWDAYPKCVELHEPKNATQSAKNNSSF